MSHELRAVNILKILEPHLPGGDNWPIGRDSNGIMLDYKYLLLWYEEGELDLRYYETMKEAKEDLEGEYPWAKQHREPMDLYDLDTGVAYSIFPKTNISFAFWEPEIPGDTRCPGEFIYMNAESEEAIREEAT